MRDATAPEPDTSPSRVYVRGKSLYLGTQQLEVRGVTYGPFDSGPHGGFEPAAATADFERMARAGVNAIRVYAPPPRWLLDLAHEHGLHVMVGIPWEQHVAFLDTGVAVAIERSVREAVRSCAGHPAVLCFAVGNEIPASIVRWHGRRRVERFLARLCRAARQEDRGALVTYVNFPSTEYLRLPEVDFLSFNVFLERRELLERYLARLQNLAHDRPLLLTELGLDSRRHGEAEQAHALQWQLEACARAGCAGTFVFAWTDQWHRGGHEIRDWDFGLTTREREPKLALAALARAYSHAPPAAAVRISVVICTYNGAATLRECLDGVRGLSYTDYEVIVVSDGSSDESARIAAEYEGVRVFETPRRGLAAARNTGMEAASGEIIAYLDDDAVPEPRWLEHLAAALADGSHAAAGGPNVLPPRSDRVAQCVANAPGGPTHVLLSDNDAEHVPGCNMAIRKAVLQEIGGFDPQFRAAGDDVDICWRLLDAGHRIAFSPGAVVSHRRRDSVSAYLRQQRAYGKAEALLERKHPEKYTPTGHVAWAGQLYGNGAAQHRGGWRWRVYYGGWGTAGYQSIYGPRRSLLESLPLMPEWFLAIALLALISAAGALWKPLLLAAPLLALAILAVLSDAALGAARARFTPQPGVLRMRLLTGAMYLLQPLARLYGRLSHGLTPWRRRGPRLPALPAPHDYAFWCERWLPLEERARGTMRALGARGAVVRSGGDWDRWDLEVRGGLLGVARLRLATEEHGAGRQFVRVRAWPRPRRGSLGACLLAAALATLAGLSGAHAATIALGVVAVALGGRVLYECGVACAAIRRSLPAAFAAAEQPSAQPASELGMRTAPAAPRRAPHPRRADARDPAR
jgi:GT2 family glycosyltransferase